MAVNRVSLRRAPVRSSSARSVVPPPFRIVVRTERDVVRICPSGDIDMDTVGQIRDEIETSTATGARRVVLDLRDVTFLGSMGLCLVLEADAASREDGWEFALIGGPARMQRIFDLTGARARLPFLEASQLSALLAAPGDPAA